MEKLIHLRGLIQNGFKANSTIKLVFEKSKRNFVFPSKCKSESLKFLMVLKIIDVLIDNLQKNLITTRRDIYYQDVPLFKTQRSVDSIISLLCTSLNYKDFEISAIASQKGLYRGKIKLIYEDKEMVKDDCFESLIPKLHDVNSIRIDDSIKYLLIIEKEAVFQLLTNYSQNNSNRILITGKGFPDQLTRLFINKITATNNVSVFGICDCDPYGLNILRQYKTGGKVKYSCDLQPLENSIMNFSSGSLMDLDQKEVKMMMKNLIEWNELDDPKFGSFTKQELQRMLFLGKKCELNMKNDLSDISVVSYIDRLCREKGETKPKKEE